MAALTKGRNLENEIDSPGRTYRYKSRIPEQFDGHGKRV